MTDEALELYELAEAEDRAKAVVYDKLRQRAAALGYASVGYALDALAGKHEVRRGTSEQEER